MPALHAMILFDEWGAYLVLGILFVIIGFSIINVVLMSVPTATGSSACSRRSA